MIGNNGMVSLSLYLMLRIIREQEWVNFIVMRNILRGDEVMTAIQKTSRKHHFVPRSYLAGFTEGGKKDSPFHVVNKKAQYRTATPASVAYENDLYNIDMPDVAPDYVEKWIGENIEGSAMPVIAEIVRAQILPVKDSEAFVSFMIFTAFLYTRHPIQRNSLDHVTSALSNLIIDMTLSSKEQYEHIIKEMRDAGHIVPDAEYEKLKEHSEDDFIIKAHPNFYLKILFETLTDAARVIAARPWDLYISGNKDFVGSDCPFCLVSPDGQPVGLGSKRARIVIPLNRRMALVSDRTCSGKTLIIDTKAVDELNQIIYRGAYREIYIADMDKFAK